ncbi:hypothetical protein MRI28_17120 [Nocardiopsis dassonvillei]|uniref:hypothetical protein n=1 Tax=Nocardiopsis dassonvillei TaxID=2014 RepID=UPI002010A688|nr:hypothetical protein [Nocardiopsis dassonvillei]MCK9871337.1 hypothetical protein [Nocardiopsis dassonvillei]
MSLLLRAPEPVGHWTWDVDIDDEHPLERAVALIPPLARALGSHRLLDLTRVQVTWHVSGKGNTRFSSLISVYKEDVGDPGRLVRLIEDARPSALPDAAPGRIDLVGSGTWVDADGRERTEQDLALVTLQVNKFWLHLTVEVQHDIWSWFDFSGTPHPDVHQKNAPRLADALREIERVMGVETEPGDPTFFGTSEKYGITTPTTKDEGAYFDARIRL